jgi:hypothetical protein
MREVNYGGWWLSFSKLCSLRGDLKGCVWELAVTDAKKECEEVVTKTTTTSFRIGTSRFKKKKKKREIL